MEEKESLKTKISQTNLAYTTDRKVYKPNSNPKQLTMKKVECFDCGKKIEVIDSFNVHIPKFRCDGCLKKMK